MKKDMILNKLIKYSISIIMLTLITMFSLCIKGVKPHASNETIKMGFFEFGGMFEGASKDAKKSGYCYEYMMQVSTYTGWNYEFVYGTYSELYEMLKNGEIDILPYTNFNTQREKEVLFSNKVLIEEEYYIAVTKEFNSEFNNCLISTLEGADYNGLLEEYITNNNLNINIKYYSTLEGTWQALRLGVVQATVVTSNAYSNDDWNYLTTFGVKPTYIAVSKNKENLLKELNEVTELIDIENPALMGDLYYKYFKDNPVRQSLTVEEQEWVNNHPVLHVGGFFNDAPYLYSIDNNTKTATGLTVDVISGIIDRLNLGIKADFKGYNTLQEMEEALDSGEIDVILPFYPSYYIAQEHGFVISNVVRVSNMELVYKKGISYNEALERIATPATKLGIYYVADVYPDSLIIGSNGIQDAVDKVLKGEATGAIAQNVVLHNIYEKYDNLNSIILSEGCGTCFATLPENYTLIRIINRGLNYFSSAEIQAISSLYNLEPNVTTRAYLAQHKEVIALIIGIAVVLIALIITLIEVSHLKQKAYASSNAKTTFLFNMSHDIRTPMNAITGFAKLAKKYQDDPDKVNEYLDKIDTSSQQLLVLVNQVLEMSRIESGKIEIVEEPVNVCQEYNTVVTVLSDQAEALGLEFHSSLSDIVHENVFADMARMSSIILNITGNAMKYTPKGGSINFFVKEIESRKEGCATLLFTVIDTGIGMSKDFIKVLYEPFTREKSSTVSKIQGAGLGMSIVKNLVDILGGKIEVDSEIGRGTRFDITIDFKINNKEIKQEVKEEISPDFFVGKKILLVEDNALNREIAIDILEEKGIKVEIAEDGVYAVSIMKSKGASYYDAILMDIQMPLMNGYEATKEIRNMYPDVHIPIIALSANAFKEDKIESLNAGMDDHIAKPIDFDKLVVVLSKFMK